jgi:hypothetical protein
MNTIKHLYEARHIRTVTTAKSAMESLYSNEYNKFKKVFLKLTDNIPIKLDKQKEHQYAEIVSRKERTQAQDAELAATIKKIDKKMHKPHVKRKTGKQQPHRLR